MSGDSRRVVIVDDEPTIATWSARALSSVGFEVRAVHTGAALRELLAAEPDWPQLIVMDMGLPDAVGTQLYAEFSNLPTRWMFVTGNVTSPDLLALSEDGPIVVGKPFRAAELRQAALDALAGSA